MDTVFAERPHFFEGQYLGADDLQTLLAYEMLFRTPVRSLFSSTHEAVAQKLRRRIRLLIRKLTSARHSRRVAKKIETLAGYLGEHASVGHA